MKRANPIVGESSAHQIIEMLNDLYNLFDDRIEGYDVYKASKYLVSKKICHFTKYSLIKTSKLQCINKLYFALFL